jgi:uncharacterized membrane protein YeaQ/YmgE (transglycosylase-associated protein family)
MANWYSESSPLERRTFWASFGGWALDALDVQMFSLAIPALIAAFHITKAEAGLLGSITLFFGAIGGWVGGALGDRFGRVKALQITIATFAIATVASDFAMSDSQLVVLKAIQGLGFGAEWACGAVLMAEIIRPHHRGTALGAVQSAWAVGRGAAAMIGTDDLGHQHRAAGPLGAEAESLDCLECDKLMIAGGEGGGEGRQRKGRNRDLQRIDTAEAIAERAAEPTAEGAEEQRDRSEQAGIRLADAERRDQGRDREAEHLHVERIQRPAAEAGPEGSPLQRMRVRVPVRHRFRPLILLIAWAKSCPWLSHLVIYMN